MTNEEFSYLDPISFERKTTTGSVLSIKTTEHNIAGFRLELENPVVVYNRIYVPANINTLMAGSRFTFRITNNIFEVYADKTPPEIITTGEFSNITYFMGFNQSNLKITKIEEVFTNDFPIKRVENEAIYENS